MKNINKISFSIITIVGFFSCESTKNDNIYDDQAFKSLTAEVISNGETIYNKNCSSCHANGIAGAPNMDDNQHWNKVAEKGYKNIFENVKKGFYGDDPLDITGPKMMKRLWDTYVGSFIWMMEKSLRMSRLTNLNLVIKYAV